MAYSGVGLWIATHESGTVCLYHLESLQHLQDVSIAPSVFRTVRDSFRRQKGCYVTCLTAHKGWLWIGTNLGVVLTIPLPRLEGVPIISSGKANVSYHGYTGPVTFLMPLMKPSITAAPKTKSTKVTHASPEKKVKKVSTKIQEENCDDSRETIPEDLNNIPITDSTKDGEDSHSLSSNNSSILNETLKAEEPKEEENNIATTSPPSNNNSTNNGSIASDGSGSSIGLSCSKTLVVLRKKSSKDNLFLRNCKTLPRGGPIPSNLRFSIDSDVYGLYGNLINVRGLEDEGRFVDPLYDALRRSDPELNALDSKISTLDRRMKMRMSRPRSLDLSNWSVDSKISVSSDDSLGFSSRNSSSQPSDSLHLNGARRSNSSSSSNSNCSPVPESQGKISEKKNGSQGGSEVVSTENSTATKGRSTTARQKGNKGGSGEKTVIVVVGGRGYINMRSSSPQDLFLSSLVSTDSSDTKVCGHLTVWQMKT